MVVNEVTRQGAARGVLGTLVLLALALPYLSSPIDDTYISAAFAHEIAVRGVIQHTSGDRIEGYSNLLWVLLQVPAFWLGWDPAAWCKGLSLFAGTGLVWLAHATLPRTARGHLLFGLLVGCPAVAYWSAMALETMAYTLIVSVTWVATFRGRAGWMAVGLVAAALIRFEGFAWLFLTLVALRHTQADGRMWRVWVRAACAIALYHLARESYFDALLPSPVHVKASGGLLRGLIQLAAESTLLVALVGLAHSSTPGSASRRAVAALPLLLGVVLLLGQNGDWMGHLRMLLPGVVPTILVWLDQQESDQRRVPLAWLVPACVGVSLVSSSLGLPAPRELVPRRGLRLETPLAPVVEYALTRVPENGSLQAADVGILGHLGDARVVDSRGLTSLRFLRRRSRAANELRDWYHTPEAPDVILVARFARLDGSLGEVDQFEPGLEPWLREFDDVLELYPHREAFTFSLDGFVGNFRAYRRSADLPSADTVSRRRRALAERFPWHEPPKPSDLSLSASLSGD